MIYNEDDMTCSHSIKQVKGTEMSIIEKVDAIGCNKKMYF